VWIANVEYSVANQQESDWVTANQNEFVRNGAKIFILPGNLQIKGLQGPIIPLFPFWGGFEKKPFGLLLVISPGEAGASLYLDPKRVHLVLDDNKVYVPVQVKGPVPLSSEDCKWPEKDEEGKSVDQEISISQAVCLGLYFDQQPPLPGRAFSIIFEGLKASDKVPAPLHVNFEKTRTQWNLGLGKMNLQMKMK
jgi:hypothetical protein